MDAVTADASRFSSQTTTTWEIVAEGADEGADEGAGDGVDEGDGAAVGPAVGPALTLSLIHI